MTAFLVALTGGPCGGKTSLIRSLRSHPIVEYPTFALPESARILFSSGCHPRCKEFQTTVVRVQRSLENAFLDQFERALVVCHRGTLDALAYWIRAGWSASDFFASTGMTETEHLRRYHSVIHLETAAQGAEPSYLRRPDAHRPETLEQARELDRLCHGAWCRHPRYCFIRNEGNDWSYKLHTARDQLLSELKYLLNGSTLR